MKAKVWVGILLLAMSGTASAGEKCEHLLWWKVCKFHKDPAPLKAPELDPASAVAALTLLAGGLAVLRGRRAKA